MPTTISGSTGVSQIQDGTVATADIADDAVTNAKVDTVAATKLTGTIADARFPGTLPAASGANLTSLPAANLTGTLPAISGANLTSLPADSTKLPLAGGTMTGNLTMGANEIILADDGKIQLGTVPDMEIFHDGSHSYVKDTGVGSLYLTSNGAGVNIQAKAGEESIVCQADAGIKMYYNNAEMLNVIEDGIKIGTEATKTFQGYEAIQLSDRGMIGGYVNDSLGIFYNTYHSSGSKAIDTAAACNIQLINTGIRFQTAPSVSADAAQTFTTVLTMHTDGTATGQWVAQAWCNWNGTGTVAIQDSFNVSSVSDYGTGHYAPTYVTSMANTNYGVYACGSFNSSNRDRHVSGRVQNAGSAECLSQAGSTATDNTDCYVLVFGD